MDHLSSRFSQTTSLSRLRIISSHPNVKPFALLACLLLLPFNRLEAARIDTLTVRSNAMNKDVKAAVALPAAYDGKTTLPVLYLLHGFSDTSGPGSPCPPRKGW
jgi:hypothetical protein